MFFLQKKTNFDNSFFMLIYHGRRFSSFSFELSDLNDGDVNLRDLRWKSPVRHSSCKEPAKNMEGRCAVEEKIWIFSRRQGSILFTISLVKISQFCIVFCFKVGLFCFVKLSKCQTRSDILFTGHVNLSLSSWISTLYQWSNLKCSSWHIKSGFFYKLFISILDLLFQQDKEF